jgi:hypothetical protein
VACIAVGDEEDDTRLVNDLRVLRVDVEVLGEEGGKEARGRAAAPVHTGGPVSTCELEPSLLCVGGPASTRGRVAGLASTRGRVAAPLEHESPLPCSPAASPPSEVPPLPHEVPLLGSMVDESRGEKKKTGNAQCHFERQNAFA